MKPLYTSLRRAAFTCAFLSLALFGYSQTANPGGVTNSSAWYDASNGPVVNMANNLVNGQGWRDRSGKNRHMTSVNSDPNRVAGGINFNPFINFDGNDYVFRTKFTKAFKQGEVFAVVKDNAYKSCNCGAPFDFGGHAADHYTWGNGAIYYGFGTNNRVGWDPATRVIRDNHPGLTITPGTSYDTRNWNIFQIKAKVNEWGAGFNGQFQASTNNNAVSFGGNNINYLGAHAGYVFRGDIAEVILFDRVLTTDERDRVESYLALKYGVTLDQLVAPQNYVASDGSTLMWDASANAGYGNDIAGIGRDDDSGLHQKQSKSVNTNSVVALALGSDVAGDNASNFNTVTTDKSFLSWGTNGMAPTFTTPVLFPMAEVNARMPRVWKVYKSAGWTDQDISLCIEGGDDTQYLLISHSDPTFNMVVTYQVQLDGNGGATIPSSYLPNGAFFTIGKAQRYPGGVSPQLQFWVDANRGTKAGAQVNGTGWLDQSGNLRHMSTIVSDPSRIDGELNYNHVIRFDGNDYMRRANFTKPFTAGEVFAVTKDNAYTSCNCGAAFDFGGHSNDHYTWGNGGIYYGFGTNDRIGWNPVTNAILDAHAGLTVSGPATDPRNWNLFQIRATSTANGGWGAGFNGYFQSTTGTNTVSFSGNNFNYLGINDVGYNFRGDMAEVILYDRVLTPGERDRVESYLALKYGLTLDQNIAPQDYIASDGTTKMWDATANGTFRHDIAGMGRDNISGLYQRQSKSANSDALIRMAVGSTFATTNQLNNVTIPNNFSFFTWSNNDASTDYSTAVTGLNDALGRSVTTRMDRIWRVSKTNWSDQDITICGPQKGEKYLLVSSDVTFGAGDAVYTFQQNGCVTLSSSLLADGAYFTLANRIAGPACVDVGIRLWLKGDYGVDQNNGAISAWSEASGNGNNSTVAVNSPTYVAEGINFNPSVNFNGSNQRFDFNNFTNGFTAGEVFYMVRSNRPKTSSNGFAAWGNNHWQHYTWGNQNVYDAFGSTTRQAWVPSVTIQQPNIYNVRAKAGQWTAWFNSKQDYNKNSNTIQFNQARTNLGFGNYIYFAGSIPEVIIYNRELLGWEKQKVNSYLALKYGVTLDQNTPTDYLASDWDGMAGTKMWDATVNAAYNQNIAGLGRDDCAEFEQKQSSSVNAEGFITMAIGNEIAASNIANSTNITNNMSFLVWGDNGKSIQYGAPINLTGTDYMRMIRTWRVDKTNWGDQNITICAGAAHAESFLLVSNTDPNFGTPDEEIELDENGCATFNSSKLPDGAYFSLARAIRTPICELSTAPGCVYFERYSGANGLVESLNPNNIIQTGHIDGFYIPIGGTNHGYKLYSNITISTAGTYTFFTSSDDGSRLYVNNKLVVNNNFIQGCTERSGTITLSPGTYPIVVEFAQGGGAECLAARYSGPSIPKQVIPCSVLSSDAPKTLQAWLRADQIKDAAGEGDVVNVWSDYSNLGNNATAGGDPTLTLNGINFNPAVYYDGNDRHRFDKMMRDNYTVIGVSKLEGSMNRRVFSNGLDNWLFGYHGGREDVLYIDNNPNRLGASYGKPATTEANLHSLVRQSSGAYNFYADGHSLYSGASSANSRVLLDIGSSYNNEYSRVFVGEVLMYNMNISASELQRVHSYLALKYGITLDQATPQDYIASDGTTLMWEAAANGIYNKNIAGLGRDDCNGLYQKQSKSQNTGELVTIAVGNEVMPNNLENTATIPDLGFFAWGNNNLGTNFDVNVTAAQADFRMARIWKVDKNANWTDQNITICIPQSGGERYLIIDDNATFSSVNHELKFNFNSGCVTLNSSLINDGDHFTIATKITGPACVDAGVQYWLRSDYGAFTHAQTVTQWGDFSGRGNNGAIFNGTPTYDTVGLMNFHPTVYYNGASAHTLPVSVSGNYSIFTVSQMQGTLNGRVFQSEVGNSLMGYWSDGEDRLYLSAWLHTGKAVTTDINMYSLQRSTNGAYEFRGEGTVIKQAASGSANVTWKMNIGGRSAFNEPSRVFVGEVVAYNRDVTAAEAHRIESYLAYKYGLTLNDGNTNYLASDGTTIMWPTDATYKHDVAGIGLDECTELNQKQSKSQNTDDIVTVALGGEIMPTNRDNLVDFADDNPTLYGDMSFLSWANNDGNVNLVAEANGTLVSARSERVWKAYKHNFSDQEITICFDNYEADAYLLISNSDPTFSSIDQEIQLDGNGCTTLMSDLLPNGAYFAVGKLLSGPGCVNAGIAMWLRADEGPNDAGSGTADEWSDYSGNANHPFQNTVANQPTITDLGTNFNPTMTFDGNDFLNIPNVTALPKGNANISVIAVGVSNNSAGWRYVYAHGNSATNQAYFVGKQNGNTNLMTGGWGNQNTVNNVWLIGEPRLVTGTHSGTTNQERSYVDGTFSVTNNRTYNVQQNRGYIGAQAYPTATEFWNGTMSEVIVYNREVSGVELQRIHSYLALKYGITMGGGTQNYLASDGSVYWNATTNGAYSNDIAGIGLDDCTALNQKQSRSVNSDALVTLALGSEIAATNAENNSIITNDKSFLVWGNNDGATTFTTSVTGLNSTDRMGRIWRVQKTNWADQDVTLCVSQGGERNLIISSDAMFGAGDTEVAFDFNTGCVTFNSSLLGDGYHFTIATRKSGPACVNTGVQLWLRADYGVGTSGPNVASWVDFSGNNKSSIGTNGVVAYNVEPVNFNPTIRIRNQTADGIRGPALGMANDNSFAVVLVTTPTHASNNNDVFAISDAGAGVIEYSTAAGGRFFMRSNNNGLTPGDISSNLNRPQLVGFNAGSGSGTGYLNGLAGTSQTPGTLANSNTIWRVGDLLANGDGLGQHFSEVVVYDVTLGATELQRINSYLALKYGITLDQTTPTDYVDSDGTTYWDATANAVYNQNIAGIGKDDCTDLHQRQSKSANADVFLTVALGDTILGSNLQSWQNGNNVTTDKTFLVWGDNGGSNDFDVTVNGTETTARIGRVWRVDKSATWGDQNVTMCFDGYNDESYLIISATDATLDTQDSELQLNANGCITLNSSLLADGAYFSLGKNIIGPACVNGGIQVWLRADDGTAADNLWADYSNNGYDAVQATVGNRPTFVDNAINFNPSLNFNGASRFLENTNAPLLNNTSATMIAVVDQTAYTTWGGVFSYNRSGNTGRPIITNTDVNNTIGANRVGVSAVKAHVPTPNPGFLIRIEYAASPNIVTATTNGGLASDTEPTWPQSGATSGYYIGRHNASGSYFNGRISEVISYNKTLSASELNRVESYLALKYGITLDQTTPTDYIASDGVTKMWDATVNATYRHDIAGLGLDECTGLHQRQSRSVNADRIITMALGSSVATSNQDNPNDVLADKTFLVWGNNDAATNFDVAVSSVTNSTTRMARVWRVDKSDEWIDQDVTICASGAGERYLLIHASDATFGAGTAEHKMNFTTGCVTISSADLADGAYFTLGTKIAGPACVNTGIYAWLRADYGASSAQWTDFSGNNNTVIGRSLAAGPTGTQNFNPAVSFAGSNNNEAYDFQMPVLPNGNSDFVVFSVVNGNGGAALTSGSTVTDRGFYARNTSPNSTFDWPGKALSTSGVPSTARIATFRYESATSTRNIIINNNTVATNSTFTLNFLNTNNGIIGHDIGTGSNRLNGTLSELVVYRGTLTNAEIQQINSYLALKYGITLDQTMPTNYVDSDGSTYWDATANATYNQNIAGIGLDECTELHQRQSKSANAGTYLTAALGDAVAATNAANSNNVTNDKSFFVWGDNGGADLFTESAMAQSATARLARVWRTDKTNWADQDITLCFSGYGESEFLIISDNDPTFDAVDNEFQLDASGCVTLNSDAIADGAYFTLGRDLAGPGCVNGGITLWLRADQGANDDGNGFVDAWTDASGNGNDGEQVTVASRPGIDGLLNFNRALSFDGSNDFIRIPTTRQQSFPTGNQNRTVFTVQLPNSAATRTIFDYGNDVASQNQSFRVEASGVIRYIGFANDFATPVNAYTLDKPFIGMYDHNGSTPTIQTDGFLRVTSGTRTYNTTLADEARIGSRFSAGEYFQGPVGEIVLYNRQLSAAEQRQVYSYLALKYGITLNVPAALAAHHYIASDGATVMWDAVNNFDYRFDIAGIGKDECTGLNQKQSRSVNNDANDVILTMALGNLVEASNETNTNEFTNDLAFLSWGNNDLATTFTAALPMGLPNDVSVRTPRIWRVTKSSAWNDAQDITVCVQQTGERYLVIDQNGTGFENDANTLVRTFNPSTGCVTISSADLPDGAYFTLGTKIVGPACVNAGIKAWYRADIGATSSLWPDYSGNSNNASQATVANQPAFNDGTGGLANFNPYYTFDGTNDFMDANTFRVDPSNSTVFAVGRRTAAGAVRDLIGSGTVASNQGMEFRVTAANRLAYGESDGVYAEIVGSNNIVTNDWYVFSATQTNSTNGIKLYQNYGFDNQGTVNKTPTTANFVSIGSRTIVSRAHYWQGQMTEVVIYDGVLSDAERQRVESYLSLKYGITMNNGNTDYLASDGTSIMWNATDNAAYNQNIAGIGKDECTDLHQKQSKSVNAGEFLTVALGAEIEATNAANPNEVSNDLSFFTWGHNGGAADFLADAGGTNATARLARVWRVDKTNWVDQDITLHFDGYDDTHYLIVHATDPTFLMAPQEYQLDANGEVTLNSSNLPDGAYFTLGINLVGPACVNGGIKMWLRADDGAATGAEWTDVSGYGFSSTQATVANQPAFAVGVSNFNPALQFDGTNDNLVVPNASLPGGFPFGTTNRTIIAVGTTNLNNGWRSMVSYGSAVLNNAVLFGQANTPANAAGWAGWANDLSGTAGSFPLATSRVIGGRFNGTTAFLDVNGRFNASAAKAWNTSSAQPLYIGHGPNATAGYFWNGNINEVIIYNRELSAAELQRVNSYLALKYGITLDQTTATNYLASDGTTLMWENDSDGFEHDIAGIGKDECTALHQKQSRSVNTDDVVTFALGSHAAIPATNAANAATVTNDKSFFTWANDNGNTDLFSTAVTATNAELRMGRIWKVDKHNWADQDVTICFAGQIGERYLLIDDNSATLASIDHEIALNPFTGCATLSSSLLGHGHYFSLGTKILAPGCSENPDVLTWLRADYGATAGQWNDFSGRTTHARQTTPANQPALTGTMNFNPAMDFTGTSFMNFDITGQNLDINPSVTDRNPITLLTVYNADVLDRPIWGNDNGGEDRYLRMQNVANGVSATAYTGGNVIGQSKLVSTIMNDGPANGSYVYADGRQVLNFTQTSSNGGLSYTMLGGIGTSSATRFDGRIGEFVAYRGALTATQLRQAESYLAIKYGLTLSNDNNGNNTTLEMITASLNEGDYIASDGMTKIWDATTNSAYHNDIAGIGQDDCTSLFQKQSRSANNDDVVTVALGTAVAATNAANMNTFTNDLAFFAWGNNDGALSYTEPQTGIAVTTRLERSWRVQKTAGWDNTQQVTICFDGYDENAFLLVSSSNTFATLDVEEPLNTDGCITISSALLPNGDYFSVGTSLSGPACVNNGILLWLRADDGTADGTAWNDYSGNNIDAAQATVANQPGVNAAAINFNPALTFDGTNDFMNLSPLNNLQYGASNRTIVSVGYSSNTVGNRWILSYGTNATSQANFWGQQGTTGNYGGFANDVTSASYWTANTPVLTANTYNGTTATIAKDGRSLVSTAKTWNTTLNKGYLGRQVSDTEYWQGGIGEVIIYNRLLTALESQQVHSYLALKYGIMLTPDNNNNSTNFEVLSGSVKEGDYVASNGTTIYWDASANSTYHNNVAGIGKDECTNLLQKQSRSINANSRLTIGLDSIAANNASHDSDFANDLTFLVWGDDNASFVETMTNLPAAFAANTKRFTRQWKVQRAGTVGDVQMRFDLTSLTVSAMNINELKLLIDRDGDGNFNTGIVDIVDASAYVMGTSVTFDGVNLEDGDIFTVASQLPEAKLTGKVFLQGPYNTASSNMNTTLNTLNVLPLDDPYGLGITAITDPNTVANIVDWVKIEIRDAATPTTILKSVAAFVRNDGTLVDINGSSTSVNLGIIPSSYHIAIRHRNHLGVMTNTALDFTGATATSDVDFTITSPAHGVYGTHARVQVATNVWALWAGDVNQDGQVLNNASPSDVNLVSARVLADVGNTGFFGSGPLNTYTGITAVYELYDVNMDGKIFDNADPSDANLISLIVLSHPANTGFFSSGPIDTFTSLIEQLP